MSSRFVLALSVLLCASSGVGFGQAGGESAAERTIELSARDKKGNPVLDLNAADVQILESGKPVPLTSLQLVRQRPAAPTVTFVFDNVDPGVAKVHGDLAEEFLKGVSGQGVTFLVFRVEGRLHLMQAPTTDVEAVRKAVAIASAGSTEERRNASQAVEERMEREAANGSGPAQMAAKIVRAMLLDSQQVARTDGRATPSVAALLAASRGQAIWPGRKFLVYFSQGLPRHRNSPEKLRDIARAAEEAQVSLYGVDAEIGDAQQAHGMNAANVIGGAGARGALSVGEHDAPGTGAVADEFASRIKTGPDGPIPQTLEALCLRTGGGHLYALGGDSRTRARGIAADVTSYYVASWVAPAKDSKRGGTLPQAVRKGVVLQWRPVARTGARAALLAAAASASEGRLIEALAAPQLPADLPFNAAVLRLGTTPENAVSSIVVQAPAAKTVSVLTQVRDRSGAVVQKFSGDIPAGGDTQAQPVLNFRRQFTAQPGEYVLESVVMEEGAGKTGASRAKFAIPALDNGLTLGDLVLVRGIEKETGDASDPLRCSEGIVVPDLSARVSKAATPKIRIFFNLHTDPKAGEAPSLAAELRRGGVLLATVPLTVPLEPQRRTIPYIFTLGSATLPPGNYQTTIVLAQGGRKVSQSISFTLE